MVRLPVPVDDEPKLRAELMSKGGLPVAVPLLKVKVVPLKLKAPLTVNVPSLWLEN